MENCQTHEKSNKNTCELFVAVWITNWSCYKKMSRRYNNESTHNVFFFFSWTGGSLQSFLVKTTANLSASNHVAANHCGLLLNCSAGSYKMLLLGGLLVRASSIPPTRILLHVLHGHGLRNPLLTCVQLPCVYVW